MIKKKKKSACVKLSILPKFYFALIQHIDHIKTNSVKDKSKAPTLN